MDPRISLAKIVLKLYFPVTSFELLAALLLSQVYYLVTLSSSKNRVLTTSIVSIFGFFFQYLADCPLTFKNLT